MFLAAQFNGANGMENKQEAEESDDLLAHALAVSLRDAGMAPPVPADADEQQLEDEWLAQALDASLGDACKQELGDEFPAQVLTAISSDPCMEVLRTDPDDLQGDLFPLTDSGDECEGVPAAVGGVSLSFSRP